MVGPSVGLSLFLKRDGKFSLKAPTGALVRIPTKDYLFSLVETLSSPTDMALWDHAAGETGPCCRFDGTMLKVWRDHAAGVTGPCCRCDGTMLQV